MNTNPRCKAKDPEKCRFHGLGNIPGVNDPDREVFLQLITQLMEESPQGEEAQFYQMAYQERQCLEDVTHMRAILEDAEASWKVKKHKDGHETLTVFRAGPPHPPEKRGVENSSYQAADALTPIGRQGRGNGLFISPTLGGVARWVMGKAFCNQPANVNQYEVDIDKTYIYNIDAWEMASARETPEAYAEYWNTGITVREYMGRVQDDPQEYDPTKWEILAEKAVGDTAENVSAARVSKQAYRENERVHKTLLEEKKSEKILKERAARASLAAA